MAAYREVLSGGDALRGLSILTSKAEVECIRCHKIRSPAGDPVGGEVGPELTGVGGRQSRAYLLESIVNPDKQIAQGFESVVVATSDGKVQTGVFRGEDDKEIRLITAEGKLIAIPKESIEERKRGPSAMPNDLAKKLSKPELRDLIEFLASLKVPVKRPEQAGHLPQPDPERLLCESLEERGFASSAGARLGWRPVPAAWRRARRTRRPLACRPAGRGRPTGRGSVRSAISWRSLFGRALVKADLERQRRNSATDEAVLVATDENVPLGLEVGLR